MISLIYYLEQKDDRVFVRAIVEDIVEVKKQTNEEPAEYGPALCEASFVISDDEVLPEYEYQEELIEYLETLDLQWTPVIQENED